LAHAVRRLDVKIEGESRRILLVLAMVIDQCLFDGAHASACSLLHSQTPRRDFSIVSLIASLKNCLSLCASAAEPIRQPATTAPTNMTLRNIIALHVSAVTDL
jgi:hypothetical protein